MLYSNFMSLRRLVVVFTLVVAMCQHIAAGMQSTRICSQMTRSQMYDMPVIHTTSTAFWRCLSYYQVYV